MGFWVEGRPQLPVLNARWALLGNRGRGRGGGGAGQGMDFAGRGDGGDEVSRRQTASNKAWEEGREASARDELGRRPEGSS